MYKGALYTNVLDTKRESGIYYINEGGKTINNWTAYGTLVVFSAPEGQYRFDVQMFIHAEGLLCFRASSNLNQWSPWRSLS